MPDTRLPAHALALLVSGMRPVGELEAAVMTITWMATAPLTVRDILDRLNAGKARQLAYTTVLSVVRNLHRKRLLDRDTGGRAHTYRPALSREEYTATLMRQTLDASADRNAALLHLVAHLDDNERRALIAYARKIANS